MYGEMALHLLEQGYQTVPIKPGTKYPEHTGWQAELGIEHVQHHAADRPAWGIGVTNVNGVDIDVMDPQIVADLEAKIKEMFPNYLKRVGLAPKFLVPTHADSELECKIKRTWYDGDQKHEIELLHKHQQQFLIYAIHPTTGQPYTWYNSDPWRTPADQLDVWTQKDFDTLLSEFDRLCEMRGFKQATMITSATSRDEPWILEHLKSNPWLVSTEPLENDFGSAADIIPSNLLKLYLDALPQKYCDDRDTWFKIGGIIYDETSGSDEGFRMFDEWSKKSPSYNGTPTDHTSDKWRDYTTKDGNAGIGTIIYWLTQENIPIPQVPVEVVEVVAPTSDDVIVDRKYEDPSGAKIFTLAEAISRFVYIKRGGKVGDIQTKEILKKAEFEAWMAPSGGRPKLATQWLNSHARLEVDDWTYYPDETAITAKDVNGRKCFNVYRPTCTPRLYEYDPEKIKVIIDHYKYLIQDSKERKDFFEWAAFGIQFPWLRAPRTFVFVSPDEGIGKESVWRSLRACFGIHNSKSLSEAQIAKGNQFTGFMAGTTFCFFDEIDAVGVSYKHLKYLIDREQMEVNHKGDKTGQEWLYPMFLMCTNNSGALSIPAGDRRFYIVSCNQPQRSSTYYAKLFHAVQDDETMSHFYTFLRTMDLSKYEWAANAPMTHAKRIMSTANMEDDQALITEMLETRESVLKYDIISYRIVKESLIKQDEKSFERISEKRIAKIMSKIVSGKPLTYSRYKIPKKVGSLYPTQSSLWCVRNHEKWAKSSQAEIVREFMLARASLTQPNTKIEATVDEEIQSYYKKIN